MTTTHYRGFRILARPYLIVESKRWTVDFEIHRHGRHKSFTLVEQHGSEMQADARCVWLGRSIIDDRIPGLSIRHLRTVRGRLGRRVLVVGATVLLALGTLALRVDQVNSHPSLGPSARLLRRGVHTVSRELQDIGGWLFDRVVAGPVIGEADFRIE